MKRTLNKLRMPSYALLAGAIGAAISLATAAAEPGDEEAQVEVLQLRASLYMIVAGGSNIVASVGPDGVLVTDTGPETTADQVLATLRDIYADVTQVRNAIAVGGAETRPNTRLAFDPPPPADLQYVRYILNTSARREHNGGNAKLGIVPERISSQNPNEIATKIYAHENVLLRVSGAAEGAQEIPYEFWPSDVYYEDFYKLPFINGEAVELLHAPAASTDGDSYVWFRGSDVISAGDLYRNDRYPEIDLAMGGSVQGVIDGLNAIVDLATAEYRAEGGTLIIPGHGRIGDIADVAYYRDMLTVIRDRVQSMIDKDLTLAQIRAAKPSFDYDARYAKQAGVADAFITSIYRSLAGE
jgi:glyoxylase-like metal-dependent hydrolase (beta-lactamase superfamily II)